MSPSPTAAAWSTCASRRNAITVGLDLTDCGRQSGHRWQIRQLVPKIRLVSGELLLPLRKAGIRFALPSSLQLGRTRPRSIPSPWRAGLLTDDFWNDPQARKGDTHVARVLLLAAVCVVVTCGALNAVGQQGDSDSIGDKLNRELHRAEDKLRETWKDVQKATHRMTVQGRVYARLYWDKALSMRRSRSRRKTVASLCSKGASRPPKPDAVLLSWPRQPSASMKRSTNWALCRTR